MRGKSLLLLTVVAGGLGLQPGQPEAQTITTPTVNARELSEADAGAKRPPSEPATGQPAQNNLPFAPANRDERDFLPDVDFEVHIRLINKRTDRISNYTLNTQAPINHDELRISARNCIENHGNIQNNNAAFLEVTNPEGYEIFSGWLFKRMPSAAAMDHPVYDIHLMDCKVQN